MNRPVEPLFKDEFTGQPPSKRVLAYIQSRREAGDPVAGIYCSYAPVELIQAMSMVPAILCAFANAPIKAAEEILPANLCPLIKSSYGFIITDTCPFFSLSDIVVAETTCDGKKKMFELISDKKPLHIMDLPQVPDDVEAKNSWAQMIKKFQKFMEERFNKTITDAQIEEAIKDTNNKNRLMNKIFDYASMNPPVISWQEQIDIIMLAQSASWKDVGPKLHEIIEKLENRVKDGIYHGEMKAARVLVTGCPIGGDSTKIYKVIEEAGGVVVAMDSCTGMKMFRENIKEGADDPVESLAEKYLKIPCSCMTPNNRRLDELDSLIDKFKPDVIVDFILHACHSYNIESYRVGKHVKEKHNLQFLKIVSDYSDNDVEQIRTRVEATLEGV